jgi:transposase
MIAVRQERVRRLKQEGLSNVRIAEQIGVSELTVRRDVDQLRQNVEADPPERVIGKDGKSYPARMPKVQSAPECTTPDDLA